MWIPLLRRLVLGERLTRDEARQAIESIMDGEAEPTHVASLLTCWALRGETPEELIGVVDAMRARVTRVACGDAHAIDTCGTGGDGCSTFNISTTVAFVAAGAGATVAKHGNHTATRASGSADVLAALGVKLDPDVATLEQLLRHVGVAFLYAPMLHPAMKHAGPVRRSLGFRTVFNLAGPLTNPAAVRRQIIGCAHADSARLVASTLAQARDPACDLAWVISGHGGVCDLTLTGPSTVFAVYAGQVEQMEIDPLTVGLPRAGVDSLLVRSAAESSHRVRQVLQGEPGPAQDIVLLNAAAALVVAGRAASLAQGVELARQSIDSGAARSKLRALAAAVPAA